MIPPRLMRFSERRPDPLYCQAVVRATAWHMGQTRRNSDPYIVHPLRVANLLWTAGADEITCTVGILHDVLEDTPITKSVLELLFNSAIADWVEQVTDQRIGAYTDKKSGQVSRGMPLPWQDRKRICIESVPKWSLPACLVKMADQIDNGTDTLETARDNPGFWDDKHVRPRGQMQWYYSSLLEAISLRIKTWDGKAAEGPCQQLVAAGERLLPLYRDVVKELFGT